MVGVVFALFFPTLFVPYGKSRPVLCSDKFVLKNIHEKLLDIWILVHLSHVEVPLFISVYPP